MKIAIPSFLLLLVLFSCTRKAREISCQGYESETISTKIYKGGKNLVNNYLYAYGAESQQKLFPKGFSLPSDSSFGLPLNISADFCKFCFVRKDLTIDTIEISYWRSFNIDYHQKCYSCSTGGHQLHTLSLGFKKDSSYVHVDTSSNGLNSYSYLVLTLK